MNLDKFFWFNLPDGVLAYSSFSLIGSAFLPILELVAFFGLPAKNSGLVREFDSTVAYTVCLEFLVIAIYASLTYGAYHKRRTFLLPYLILVGLFIVASTLVWIYITFKVFTFSLLGTFVAYMIYKWLAVLSYYRKMHQFVQQYSNPLEV